MYLFLVHSLLLTGASYGAARRLLAGGLDRILATAALAWGNVVVTSLLLSGLHRLGEPAWFFRTSLLLAAATWLLLRRVAPEPAPAPPAAGDRLSRLLVLGFILGLAPLAYWSIRIAAAYEPNNFDSLTYHLPRVMFYLGQDTLGHFSTGNDRQVYFPFNYNLLQLLGLIYRAPLQTLNFINLATWGLAGLAVFRLARLGGASANASLIATWLALTSTQILAQATATTNDLPTGAGLLATLVFAFRWGRTRLTRDAVLAGLALGLTAGAKLTVIFFAPAGGLIILWLGWTHARRGELGGFLRGARAWVVPGLLAFALASPFALINLAAKGQWLNHTYDYTLNRPFSPASVVQTTKAYLFQLAVDPVHRFSFDQPFTRQLNDWSTRVFFPHWNQAHAFSPFVPFPADLNEDHVWFGFTGPFIVLCAAACLLRFRRRSATVVWLAWLGLGWFATYFVLNKWSLYNQRYFVLAMLVLSPAVAAVIDATRARAALRHILAVLLTGLALVAFWLGSVYLFDNTSRPYAPLWAETPPPPAVPKLPAKIVRRLAEQPLVNFDSTDGNERAFLFMTHRADQRFIASNRIHPEYYTLFSQWGFPRRVAYSNIEQKSSYTLVHLPTKRTAGVEFLGTVGSGQPALDYLGLIPHADQTPASEDDRNVLVELSYRPNNPDRYAHTRVKVAGLNPADEAKLVLEVQYEDHTRETLASFTATGEAQVSVTRPFRRFILTATNQSTGNRIGGIDIPYLYRSLPPDIEAPENPLLLFAEELIMPHPEPNIATTGLDIPEGPYPQWKLPLIRWAKAPVVRMEIPARVQFERLELTAAARLEARSRGQLDVVFNGVLAGTYTLEESNRWFDITLSLTPRPGPNVLEFRNVVVGTEPDWLDYLARYPDVQAYLVAQKIPLEQGAREHYEQFGKKENRVLHPQRQTDTLADPKQLYYLFSTIRLDGFRNP